jgi:hypothetical protein
VLQFFEKQAKRARAAANARAQHFRQGRGKRGGAPGKALTTEPIITGHIWT